MSHSPDPQSPTEAPTTPAPQLAPIRRLEAYQFVVREVPNCYSIELHCPPDSPCHAQTNAPSSPSPSSPSASSTSPPRPHHQIALLNTYHNTLHIHAINITLDHRPESAGGCPHASAIYLAFWTKTLNRPASSLRVLQHRGITDPGMVAIAQEVFRRLYGVSASPPPQQTVVDEEVSWGLLRPERAVVMRESWAMLMGSNYGLTARAVVERYEGLAGRGRRVGRWVLFRYVDCAGERKLDIQIVFVEGERV